MSCFEEIIRAATRRFAVDPTLRKEIACELRGHMEESLQVARSEGLGEAQAEEAAVRAFGDPEEVGEKLWQANRRRAVKHVFLSLVALLGLTVFVQWFAEFLWTHRHAIFSSRVEAGGLIALAVLVIYVLSVKFLPRSARLDLAYLRWLPTAFFKSVSVIVRNPWIWVTSLVGIVGNVGMLAISYYATPQDRDLTSRALDAVTWWPTSWGSAFFGLSDMRPVTPFNGPAVTIGGACASLLAVFFLVFAFRVPRLLCDTGTSRSRARRWNILFVIGACAMILIEIINLWAWRAGMLNSHNGVQIFDVLMVNDLFGTPFQALIEAAFFVVMLRCICRQHLSIREVAGPAFRCVPPLLGLLLIFHAYLLLVHHADRFLSRVNILPYYWEWERMTGIGIYLLMPLLTVIVITEQCSLLSACRRLVAFLRCYFWRYAAFYLLGGLSLIFLRPLLECLFVGEPVAAFRLTHLAAHLILETVFTVMWFEFYRTKAGTSETVVAETASLGRAD